MSKVVRWSTLILTTLVLLVGIYPSTAQQRNLAGFQYVSVVLPTYTNGGTDIHGFGRLLEEKFREEPGWIVVDNATSLASDRRKLSQTLLCTLEHTALGTAAQFVENRVTITFFDMLGNRIRTISTSSIYGFPTGVQRAIGGVFKELREIRPRFNPAATVDLINVVPNVERVAIDLDQLEARLMEGSDELSAVEGVWADPSGQYTLAIFKDDIRSAIPQFVAVVTDTEAVLWESGMVKARLRPTAATGAFLAEYFDVFHRESSSTAILADNVLSIPFTSLDGQDQIADFVRVSPTTAAPNASSMESGIVSTGTGFVAAPRVLVTNHHVVDGGRHWEVVFPTSGETFELELLVADRANDLAVLRLHVRPGQHAPPPIGISDSSTARLGEDLYTIGFPLGDLLGKSHKVTTGVMSATSGLDGDPRMFQLTVPSQPGNSGGPVLNADGAVVGVFTSTLRAEAIYEVTGHLPQNVNFGMRSEYVTFLLRQAGVEPNDEHIDVIGLSREDQIQTLQSSIGQVTTYASASSNAVPADEKRTISGPIPDTSSSRGRIAAGALPPETPGLSAASKITESAAWTARTTDGVAFRWSVVVSNHNDRVLDAIATVVLHDRNGEAIYTVQGNGSVPANRTQELSGTGTVPNPIAARADHWTIEVAWLR